MVKKFQKKAERRFATGFHLPPNPKAHHSGNGAANSHAILAAAFQLNLKYAIGTPMLIRSMMLVVCPAASYDLANRLKKIIRPTEPSANSPMVLIVTVLNQISIGISSL